MGYEQYESGLYPCKAFTCACMRETLAGFKGHGMYACAKVKCRHFRQEDQRDTDTCDLLLQEIDEGKSVHCADRTEMTETQVRNAHSCALSVYYS